MLRQTSSRSAEKGAPSFTHGMVKSPLHADPSSESVFRFQHAYGNQFVQQKVSACAAFGSCPTGGACHTCRYRVQTKSRIDSPGDRYELEADRAADAIINQKSVPTPSQGSFRFNRTSEP